MEEDFWRRRLGLWDATASKLFNQFLVGGFKHVLFSIIHTYIYIWDVILPIDELICFKMFIAPPTRYMAPWERGHHGILGYHEKGSGSWLWQLWDWTI
jgi:hypothetical protein